MNDNNIPPPPAPDLQPRVSQMDSNEQSPTSLWDWSHILDFTLIDDHNDHQQPTFPFQPPPNFPLFDLPPLPPPTVDSSSDKSDRIRKRDPRVTCSNFLAGRVPCACPELDALIREEEEAGVPVKKRVRTARAAPGTSRCQVPGCESDISQLKGYHRRHRVCLRCANATSVVLDAQSKRYCQQCGKFHVLSDFDEGKRSCRRKLQRHNNRRRRKPGSGSRDSDEKEPQYQQELSTEDIFCGNDFQNDDKSSNSQAAAEGGTWLNTEEQIATLPSGHIPQNNIQCDSGLSLAVSDETQIDEEREMYTNSPSYHNNKNPLRSGCTTGRISFKLYDWNPAEFPRRLRHQIFQWLASMPVELEGYIRPGCTILTMFIAMPKFMWIKLLEEPVVHIHDLVVAPGSILCGRGTFLVYLDNIIYRVLKDGTSVVKVEVERESPKLHYVHPTCFEAGKPMEFVACGSNLFQPKLRFLVSFAGKYITHDVCLPSSCNNTEAGGATLDHQLFKIYVPHTEPDIYGPAFIEVENQYGLSNFIPILIGSKEICSEINIVHQKLNKPLCSDKSEFLATSSLCGSSVSKQKDLSKLILDVAWLLKEPSLINTQKVPISYQIQRFNYLLNILIENESTAVVERALKYMKIVMDNSVITSIADVDMSLYQRNINHARDMLDRKLPTKLDSRLLVRNLDPEENGFDHNFGSDKDSLLRVTNQDMRGSKLRLTGEVFMRIKEWGKSRKTDKPNSGIVFKRSIFASHPIIIVIATAAVCFGVCVAILHPVDVGKIATTFRRCMSDKT